jgi:hypothetical protein
MKTFFLILFLFTISFFGFSQENKTKTNKTILYFNAGANIAAYDKEGFQVGFTYGKMNHVFQVQYLNTQTKEESTGFQDVSLNATTGIKAYSFMYGYVISKKEIFNFIPSAGIIGGKENFRTEESEFVSRSYGCGYCFFRW